MDLLVTCSFGLNVWAFELRILESRVEIAKRWRVVQLFSDSQYCDHPDRAVWWIWESEAGLADKR